MTRRMDAVTTVRQSADDPHVIEGIALPYLVRSAVVDLDGMGTIGYEIHEPGAGTESVNHWMSRKDGGRLPYRPRHGEKPVGTVHVLRDTPAGVEFQARIFDTPAGNDYLQEVAAGINGVSVELASPDKGSTRRMRDGTVVHKAVRFQAIAGSDKPAYDGARIALRDLEDTMTTEAATEPIPTENTPERDAATTAVAPIAPAVRNEIEANDPVVQSIARSNVIFQTVRPEAIYGPRSEHGFFHDMEQARRGDSMAIERQQRHDRHLADIAIQIERAGDVLSSEIPGAYPNDYLPGLLTPRILKGRPMGGFYNRVPISDARPHIFAKVSTSTTVAVQSAEGTNPAASDFATTAVTATPLLYGAETVVSRQVIDGASPGGDAMVIQDMIEAYAQASETVIKTAVEAGATASGSAITAATPYAGLQANVVAYQAARFKPALGQFVPPALYTVTLAQADTTGRPFYTYINPVNSQATVDAGGASGNILGATEFLSWASTVNVVVTGRPEDYVIFESSIARFSYEAVTGPAGVRIGIWAYLVVGTRLGSLKVTAA